MPLETDIQRGKLRLAVEVYAPRAGKSLRDWIIGELATLDNRTGVQVVTTSANGSYVQFGQAADTMRAPSDLLAFWGSMLDLYDRCRAALVSSGVSAPTQAQIVSEMLARMAPIREAVADFRSIHHDYEEALP